MTNVFMDQCTIPTDTNELPNVPTRNDVETWWLTNEETINSRSENDWTIDLEPHTVTTVTHDDDDTTVVKLKYFNNFTSRNPISSIYVLEE